jgi:hypothetical protein
LLTVLFVLSVTATVISAANGHQYEQQSGYQQVQDGYHQGEQQGGYQQDEDNGYHHHRHHHAHHHGDNVIMDPDPVWIGE